MQTTTGLYSDDYCSGVKRLFVSYANNYLFDPRTTTGPSANDYSFLA